MSELRFFNPFADIRQTENRLPHWQQTGAVYFLTFRMADALPTELLSNWQYERESWLRLHAQPWDAKTENEYHQRFAGRIDVWLDAGYGSCALREVENAKIVANTLKYFDGVRVEVISFVIMPNHVHVLFVLNGAYLLEQILDSWEKHASRRINERMKRRGRFWQKDYFDRLVRDQRHFANCVRYIRQNPRKAPLGAGEYVLFENAIARGIE